MDQLSASSSTPKPRRRWRWVLSFAGVLVVVAVTARWVQSVRVQSQLESIRQAGFPVTLEELNAWYPEVPDEDNAALAFLDATDRVLDPFQNAEHLPVSGKAEWPEAGVPLPEAMRTAIAQHLADNKDALDAVRRAAQLSRSRYPVDVRPGVNTLLPHLAQLKKLAQLLRMEAGYHSSQGQPDLAVRSVLDGLALAHSLAEEPLLISDLVRIACVAIALQGLERTTSEHALTEGQIKALMEKLRQAEADGSRTYIRAMAGERCFGTDIFTASPNKLATVLGASGNGVGPQAMFTAWRMTGLHTVDFRFYLDLLGDMIQVAQQAHPQALEQSRQNGKKMQEALAKPMNRLMIVSRNILPALERAFEKEVRLCAQLRAAQTALAVERYRLAHQGRLPEKLSELFPAFLEKELTDPFDGQPLELERLTKGYRVLCGAATQDRNNPKSPKGKPHVVGFVVQR